METKEMNTIEKIVLVNGHLANAMKLAADLRVEMEMITDGICINKDGVIVIDHAEYCEACGDLDCIITMIGNLTGLLISETVFGDVEKRMEENGMKLTEAQKKRLSKV